MLGIYIPLSSAMKFFISCGTNLSYRSVTISYVFTFTVNKSALLAKVGVIKDKYTTNAKISLFNILTFLCTKMFFLILHFILSDSTQNLSSRVEFAFCDL